MGDKFEPKLCGGMFFNILLLARKGIVGAGTKINTPDMLAELLKVAIPDYIKPAGNTFRGNVTDYRKCQLVSNTYIPVDDDTYISSFDRAVQSKYYEPLKRMHSFAKKCLQLEDTMRIKKVFSLLIGIIDKDKSIKDDDLFFIGSGPKTVTKKELLSETRITAENFLLAVWHYILVYRKDNTVGIDTFDKTHTLINNKYYNFSFAGLLENTRDSDLIIQTLDEQDVRLKRTTDNDVSAISIDDAKIASYLNILNASFSKLKTLFYTVEPHSFKDFYVCNGIAKDPNIRWAYGKSIATISQYTRTLLDSDFINFSDDEKLESIVLVEGTPSLSSLESMHLELAALGNTESVNNATAISLLKMFDSHMIITGIGGLGKSMMMRHLLLDAIENYSIYKLVPVFVPLKDYSNDYSSFFDFVYSCVTKYSDFPLDEFKSLLINGHLLLLLDGIDEIKGEQLSHFENEIDAFSNKYSTNVFIMSSRPNNNFVNYQRFTRLELQPLTKKQSMELIRKLETEKDREAAKQRFLDEIDNRLFESHKEFVSNPLLLTIMLITFETYAEIPEKTHVFYREAFSALSTKHDATKNGFRREYKTKLNPDELGDLFAEFCARSYYEDQLNFTEEDIARYFKQLKTTVRNPNYTNNYKDFIDDIINGVCLMYFEGGEYHFTHRSFQEYFCAYYFSKQKDSTLESIGDFFEKKQNATGDMTFSMLYEMIPAKTRDFIIVPYMEKLINKCESQNGYQTFLEEMYNIIYYSVGDIPDIEYVPLLADSFLFPYVQGLINTHRMHIIATELPGEKAFIQREFVHVKAKRIIDGETVERDELASVDSLRNSDGTSVKDVVPDGSTYRMPVKTVYSHKDKYKKMIEALESPSFPLMDEYIKMKKWLAGYKENKKRTPNDFFGQFD